MPHVENGVGYKADGPARDAAEAQVHRVEEIRAMILDVLRASVTPLSADEIAKEIGVDFMSVRPRVSELHKMGRVRDSGQRRHSRTGRSATGWDYIGTAA